MGAALLLCCVAVSACSNDEGTTTVEPSTTPGTKGSASSTIVTSEAGIDAIVRTWVQLGFSEDQARCLAEQMNQMSASASTTTDASTNQNLIEQMMKVCKIEDESLKAQLGG